MLCCTDTICDVLLLDCSRPSPLQGQRQETGLVTDPALAAHNELGIIIFIRNMPISTTEEALYMLFAKHGTVRKVSITTNLLCPESARFSLH